MPNAFINNHRWIQTPTPSESYGMILFMIKYAHENRSPLSGSNLPRNLPSIEISALEQWVLKHEDELECIETNTPLTLRSGKRMEMLSFDMLDSQVEVDSPKQRISMGCWAWNRYLCC